MLGFGPRPRNWHIQAVNQVKDGVVPVGGTQESGLAEPWSERLQEQVPEHGSEANPGGSAMESEEPFGEVFEDYRVIWVVEQLQDGKWTARYCWHEGTSIDAGKALQRDVLNGKSKRLLALYPTEAEAITAIKEAVLLEAKWNGGR